MSNASTPTGDDRDQLKGVSTAAKGDPMRCGDWVLNGDNKIPRNSSFFDDGRAGRRDREDKVAELYSDVQGECPPPPVRNAQIRPPRPAFEMPMTSDTSEIRRRKLNGGA